MLDATDLSIHDRIDHIEADRIELRAKAKRLAEDLARAQSESVRLRADCRSLARTLTDVEAMLDRRLADAVDDAEVSPGKRVPAARAAEARAALHAFWALTERRQRDG